MTKKKLGVGQTVTTVRGKKVFDWKELNAILVFKMSKKFCSKYFGISEDTLERRIREEHDMTFTEYKEYCSGGLAMELQQVAIEKALDGNASMLMFALKNIAGWSDKVEQKVEQTLTLENLIDQSYEAPSKLVSEDDIKTIDIKEEDDER